MRGRPIERLLAVMAALRTPASGCAWDLAQTFETIAPYTIEEAYEVADAIAREDMADLREELGDLLFQVVFHARMAEEQGAFGFDDVVTAIVDKMVRRHPHVFGEARVAPADLGALWDGIKAAERARKGAGSAGDGALAGIAVALPALMRAEKLSKRAARVGFDWPDTTEVLAKVREETAEVEEALAAGEPEAVAEEIGDLLFSVANLARHAGVDPEQALVAANRKFERRFGAMEASIRAEGRSLPEAGLEAMETAWTQAKARERGEA